MKVILGICDCSQINILEQICSHMDKTKLGVIWTKEKCGEVALLCQTQKEFRAMNATTYIIAWRNKWLNDICIHMKRTIAHSCKMGRGYNSIRSKKV